MKSLKFKNIVALLKTKAMKAEIMFACSVAHLFSQFTGKFQKEEPLVHIMYDEIKTLTSTLMGRICHSTARFSIETFKDDKNFLPLKEINCGGNVTLELNKVSEKDKLVFLTQAKKHYTAACKHIFNKSSLDNPLLKNLQCLTPRDRVKERSCKMIVKVAKSLPFDVEECTLVDEWKRQSFEKDEIDGKINRIDVYWNKFFQKTDACGDVKYPTVAKVIKSVLSLAHGSGHVERGFSSSTRILTHDRASMSERTLDAHLQVKGALQQMYDGRVHLVYISRELLSLARTAHVYYEQYCEEQRRKTEQKLKEKEEEEKQISAEKELEKRLMDENKGIAEKESTLKRLRDEEEEKRLISDRLLKDANERLKEAIKNKDLVGANVAQTMLEGMTKFKEEAEKKKKDADKIQNTIEKRKSSLITNFFNKKPKKN